MFYTCSSLTSLNLSSFDTSNVTSMGAMFYSCSSLTNLDLSNLDTSNVTNMSSMFDSCSNLEHIFVGDNWNTSGVTGSPNMFNRCTKLPNFNSSYTDKTMAYVGGYLEELKYSIQLKHNGYKAYPKVAVDGTTIVDNNGVLSVVPSGGSDITLVVKGVI